MNQGKNIFWISRLSRPRRLSGQSPSICYRRSLACLKDPDSFSCEYTRRHNDANALCMGGRVVGPGLACQLVDIFLNTEFEGGRHEKRIAKLMAIENR